MTSRNPRTAHNKLASQFLCRLLDWRKWDELKLAEASGILPGVIFAHLSGNRPIRPQHLGAYLRVLDREERIALLDAWLQDNVDGRVVANLLEGTKTDSMPSVEQNRSRMLDWWAMAIARDSKIAKIFGRFRVKSSKGASQYPVQVLSALSSIALQFQGWLLEKACTLLTRVKHAAIGLVTLVLALCQQGRITQQAGEVAEQGSEFAAKGAANSLIAASLVAPTLADTNLDGLRDGSSSGNRKSEAKSRSITKAGAHRREAQPEVAPALRIQRTIDHEWHRLARTPRSVHSAFNRLIRDARRPRFKLTHRK
ncbi:MAG TPA: hypothetical protein VFQ83_05205 [Candidatus Udaeobacter sp.]|nr:hypothetical protein [Candidatus Udaeobacter sp.]